jgi:hypothetical protein
VEEDVRSWIGEHGWEVALFGAAAGVLAAHVFGRLVADPDLWGHVRFGQLILSEGLPELDPFAYTSGDHPWVNHEILSEVAFGWTYAHLGPAGLQGLRYGLIGAITLLVWRELAEGDLGAAGGVLGTAWVITGMGAGLATVRPHLFTYLFFLVVLIGLVRIDEGETRWAWIVPLVVAVWINFHGGVLAGVGVVGLWWAGKAAGALLGGREPDGVPLSGATLMLAGSGLALLLNPYGWELPVFLLDTATEARPIISEWQSVADSADNLALWLLFTALGGVVIVRARTRIQLLHALLLAVLAFLPLLASRHLPLYALGWGVLLAPHMPDLVGRLRKRRRERKKAGTLRLALEAALVAAGFFAAAGGLAVAAERFSPSCIPLASAEADQPIPPMPHEAVRVLEESRVSGNLATPFNWGEYVIWRLGPGVQVGMDGRRETVYPDSVYGDFKAFRTGAGDWHRWLERYGADMALVATETPPDNLLALKDGWREVHRDDVSALYGREGWPGTRRVVEAAAGAPGPPEKARCFPAGAQAGPS